MTHPYADHGYAAAFSSLADVFIQPEWNLPLIRRTISGSARHDVCGLYPMAGLAPSTAIEAGLAALRRQGAVSLVMVPDPLTAPSPPLLAAAFDVCRPFKTHYVLDRSLPGDAINKHHRYEIRKARRQCSAEIVSLADHIDSWMALYGGLVDRHGIEGYGRFSRAYFTELAGMADATAMLARVDDVPVAMSIWLAGEDIAYYHLAAASELGYRTNAMYLLVDAALDHFAAKPLVHFGGAAGFADSDDSGLARFKRGFANRTVAAHLCGSILDPGAYRDLAGDRADGAFFPAYRG